jgi:hypothetical protein
MEITNMDCQKMRPLTTYKLSDPAMTWTGNQNQQVHEVDHVFHTYAADPDPASIKRGKTHHTIFTHKITGLICVAPFVKKNRR